MSEGGSYQGVSVSVLVTMLLREVAKYNLPQRALFKSNLLNIIKLLILLFVLKSFHSQGNVIEECVYICACTHTSFALLN